MRKLLILAAGAFAFISLSAAAAEESQMVFHSSHFADGAGTLELRDFFFETETGRVAVPWKLDIESGSSSANAHMTSDGRGAWALINPEGDNFDIRLYAESTNGIVKWGFSVDAKP